MILILTSARLKSIMQFKDPERVLDQFVLGEGRIVADFGAGSGAYTLASARRVGGEGKVYAIDIQRDLLNRLKNTATQARLHNVQIVWGDVEKQGGSQLKDASADVAIISNILFQAEDKSAIAREAHRILKKEGRALLVEWADSGTLGPSGEHLVSKDDARHIFENSHFSFEREINAGSHHYGMVFRKI
ncbi:MAG: methyltransferase domain-containing protein [bacterium]|nr:methyltransferase domain-containing protein [bacterium]